jgi:Ca2+-binding RTX toxin-like protein
MDQGAIVYRPGRVVTGTAGSDRVNEDGDLVSTTDGWISFSSDDLLKGLGGDDFIWGYFGNDTILGGAGNDYLDGGPGNDIVRGEAGNDRLLANGNATLEGGIGNDTYEHLNGGRFRINDTSGNDTVSIGEFVDSLTGVLRKGGNDLFIKTGSLSLTIENYFVTGKNGGHIETLQFMGGVQWHLRDVLKALEATWESIDNDAIYGDVNNNRIDGGAGNDALYGFDGEDVLIGGSGNDTLTGGHGNDTLNGGLGDDLYRGMNDDGDDVIADAGGDNDQAHFLSLRLRDLWRAGNDLVIRADGEQVITINGYFDVGASGGHIETLIMAGKEWHLADVEDHLSETPLLAGTRGNDRLNGDSGGEILTSYAGKDVLQGKGGADVLKGGTGSDILDGGNGRDVLFGGSGRDNLKGGSGKDVFVFASRTEAGSGSNRDVIVDFSRGSDKIDLRSIDANTMTEKDNAFTALLSGDAAFTTAGQLRYDSLTGVLSGNTDVDADAEFEIALKNKPVALDLRDFLL